MPNKTLKKFNNENKMQLPNLIFLSSPLSLNKISSMKIIDILLIFNLLIIFYKN
jgi:hypothetical protein